MLKEGDISGTQERAVTSEKLQQHRPQYEQSLEAVMEQLQREKSEGAARNNGKQKKSILKKEKNSFLFHYLKILLLNSIFHHAKTQE